MFAKVLLAVDCWPESRAAIDATKDLIRGTSADVLVLHIRERQYARSFVWEPGLPGDAQELVDCTVYELARLGHYVRAVDRSAPVGRVADEIATVACRENVDLIIVGSRGLSCIGGFMAGSVCHRLIKLAHRPVLIAAADGKNDSQSYARPEHKTSHRVT